jgi:hypothetical protein
MELVAYETSSVETESWIYTVYTIYYIYLRKANPMILFLNPKLGHVRCLVKIHDI